MELVTLFVTAKAWHEKKPCLDLRYDTQHLPGGTWVLGFAVRGKGFLCKELPGLLDAESEEVWPEMVGYLRDVGNGAAPEEYPAKLKSYLWRVNKLRTEGAI